MSDAGTGKVLFTSTADFLDRMPASHCPFPQPRRYCSLCRRVNSSVAAKCPYSGIYAAEVALEREALVTGTAPAEPSADTGASEAAPAAAEGAPAGEAAEGAAPEGGAAGGEAGDGDGGGEARKAPEKEAKRFKIVPTQSSSQISFVSSGSDTGEPKEMEVLEEGVTFEYKDPNAADVEEFEVEEFEDDDEDEDDGPETGDAPLQMRPVTFRTAGSSPGDTDSAQAGQAPATAARPPAKAKVKVKAKVKTKPPAPAPPAPPEMKPAGSPPPGKGRPATVKVRAPGAKPGKMARKKPVTASGARPPPGKKPSGKRKT